MSREGVRDTHRGGGARPSAEAGPAGEGIPEPGLPPVRWTETGENQPPHRLLDRRSPSAEAAVLRRRKSSGRVGAAGAPSGGKRRNAHGRTP